MKKIRPDDKCDLETHGIMAHVCIRIDTLVHYRYFALPSVFSASAIAKAQTNGMYELKSVRNEFTFQALKIESLEISKKLVAAVEEHDSMRAENHRLQVELDHLRRNYEDASRRLQKLERELDRRNQTSEVVNLCKLLLTGSLVPFISIFVFYWLMDGSLLSPIHAEL
jgi:septal ring factor EnvC (AmiA/AmiB activator)